MERAGKECAVCGKVFFSMYRQAKYCSDGCRKTAVKGRKYRKSAPRREKERNEYSLRYIKEEKAKKQKPKEDGFSWDDIRAVMAETGIASYGKIIAILEKRKRSAEATALEKAEEEVRNGEKEG